MSQVLQLRKYKKKVIQARDRIWNFLNTIYLCIRSEDLGLARGKVKGFPTRSGVGSKKEQIPMEHRTPESAGYFLFGGTHMAPIEKNNTKRQIFADLLHSAPHEEEGGKNNTKRQTFADFILEKKSHPTPFLPPFPSISTKSFCGPGPSVSHGQDRSSGNKDVNLFRAPLVQALLIALTLGVPSWAHETSITVDASLGTKAGHRSGNREKIYGQTKKGTTHYHGPQEFSINIGEGHKAVFTHDQADATTSAKSSPMAQVVGVGRNSTLTSGTFHVATKNNIQKANPVNKLFEKNLNSDDLVPFFRPINLRAFTRNEKITIAETGCIETSRYDFPAPPRGPPPPPQPALESSGKIVIQGRAIRMANHFQMTSSPREGTLLSPPMPPQCEPEPPERFQSSQKNRLPGLTRILTPRESFLLEMAHLTISISAPPLSPVDSYLRITAEETEKTRHLTEPNIDLGAGRIDTATGALIGTTERIVFNVMDLKDKEQRPIYEREKG